MRGPGPGWTCRAPGQRLLGFGHFLCQRGAGGRRPPSASSWGTPPRGFCRLGPSLPPPAWVGPQGSSSPVGPAQTGQRARPRTASDVLAHTPGDVGGRAIWLWVPQSALQEGPPGGGPGTLAGPSLLQAGVTPPQVWDGERTGPPGAVGGGPHVARAPASTLPAPPGRRAAGGLPGVLPAPDARLPMAGSRGLAPLRESPDAPSPRLPGSALLPFNLPQIKGLEPRVPPVS